MALEQAKRDRRHSRQAPVGAVIPETGRYEVQGVQMRAGLELWARRARAELDVADDRSEPGRSAAVHEQLRRRCRFVLGPYGSDSTRAVALSADGAVVWNHGAAADDVQRLEGVVSLPSPASQYLVALARGVATIRPGARIAVVAASGRFAEEAVEGLARQVGELGVALTARFALADPPASIAEASPDAVLACGPLRREAALLAELSDLLPGTILAGVSPGVAGFTEVIGRDVEGALAPVQWYPAVEPDVLLGPTGAQVATDASPRQFASLDYVAVQAYAAAVLAEHCTESAPADPLAYAKGLRTTTFFGRFRLDPATGLQIDHRVSVVRRVRGQRVLHLADAA